MKKFIYSLILILVVVSGLLFANREFKNETSKKPNPKPPTNAERNAALKKWEASPDGIMFKKWEASLSGKRVDAGAAKISKPVRDYTNMEGIITSLSLPSGSRLGFGMMVKINDEYYILTFGAEESRNNSNFINKFKQLHSLKVNDKIIIKSHNIFRAPKYAYPIVMCEYAEQDGKIIYKRAPNKGGC